MEKINNREYKNKQKWPQYVYVCDFYSRQLDEIRGLIATLITVNIVFYIVVLLRFF